MTLSAFGIFSFHVEIGPQPGQNGGAAQMRSDLPSDVELPDSKKVAMFGHFK
jgi:hypothetical protein